MSRKYHIFIVTFFSLFVVLSFSQYANAESLGDDLGTIYDLDIDGNSAYFFEHDNSKSDVFVPDTRVLKYDGEKSFAFSEHLFMLPSELHIHDDYLYFVVLSDSCEGSVTCDFQNIVKMSKHDGTFEALSSDALYASESSGYIWKISYNDYSKELLHKSEHILMDISTTEDSIFWIEEVEDLNNRVMKVSKNKGLSSIISDDLQIAYDLTTIGNSVFWSDIRVQSTSGGVGDFTYVMKYDGTSTHRLFEYLNTSLLSQSQTVPHYGAYLYAGDYIFMVNNTKTNPQPLIQMKHFTNDFNYDVATASDYIPRYMKAESTSLYVVGQTQDGFTIHHYVLPVPVPEFGLSTLLIATFSTFLLLFFIKVLPKTRLNLINN